MEWITKKEQENALVLAFHGRVDSANAGEVEAQIAALRKDAKNPLILDAEDLQYISSAGLRIILRLRKECPDVKIVNASSEVYDIFEMTGFTEMMPVEKAYRRVSVEGCEVIGKGANGLVYRLDPDTIIKVYMHPDSLEDIRRERELARRAFVLGVPTAIPYDVVKVGESYGSVFELLNAKSFAKLLVEPGTDMNEIAAMYVGLLKKIHGTEVQANDLPDSKIYYVERAESLKNYLSAEKYEKLLSLVAAVPDSNRMMHGDYHVKNVMLQNGEALLIDMDTLSRGDLVFEFSGMFNAYIGYGLLDPKNPSEFLGIPMDMLSAFWQKTLSLYFTGASEAELRTLEDKIAVISYMRLLSRTIRKNGTESETGKRHFDAYRNALSERLDRVNDLNLFA